MALSHQAGTGVRSTFADPPPPPPPRGWGNLKGTQHIQSFLILHEPLFGCRKWRTINHPDSVTPFAEASYINALLRLELREITHDDHTFAEWEGMPKSEE